ncbi:MAG: hypothetical protein WC865_04415 [Bacteroidales bacterium]
MDNPQCFENPELASLDPLLEVAGTILINQDEDKTLSDREQKVLDEVAECLEEHELEEAYRILEKSVKLFPESIPINQFLFAMTLSMRSPKEIAMSFEHFLNQFPDNLGFRHNCINRWWRVSAIITVGIIWKKTI